MNFYLNLFLSNNNLKYEVESSNGIIPTVENKNDRILERESRKVDNVRLNIVMFNLAYPKAIEDVVNTPDDIMEQHYDTSLILEIYDDEEKKLYTFYDLLYSTNKSLDNATIEYNKLHEIIFSSDNAEDLLNSIVELTK